MIIVHQPESEQNPENKKMEKGERRRQKGLVVNSCEREQTIMRKER